MRICDLTTLYLDGGQGGVNTYLTEKARYLAGRADVRRHLIVVPGRRTRRFRLFDSVVQTIKSPRLPSNPIHRVLTHFAEVGRVLSRERPTVVEVDCAYFLGRAARLARRAADVPVVGMYHVHFPTFIARPSAARLSRAAGELAEKLAWRYVRYCYGHLDRLVVPTEDIRRRLGEQGFERLEHVPFGVNLELFRPGARRPDGGPTEILYVGRLSREKELDVLIEAYRLLCRRGRFGLQLVGDGPMRRPLERQAAGLDGVRFLGARAYGPPLAAAYATADLLASPSPAETFNLTILEAFACGMPVVSVAQGGPLDLVGPGLGALAAPGDAADLADKIEQVALHRAEYRTRAHVEQSYSWARSFDRLLEVYRETGAAPRGRFVILGAGAVGSYLGQAVSARAPVVLVDPDAAVRAAWDGRGAQTLDPAALPGFAFEPDDVVLLATKSTAAAAAVASVAGHVPVVSISNGINPALKHRPQTTFGVVDFAVSSTGPGTFHCTRPGSLILGRGDSTRRLADALHGSQIRVELSDAIEGHIWSKLLLNASFDPVCAATGLTYGQLFDERASLHAFRVLLEEGVAVARAAGIELRAVQGVSPATLARVLGLPLLARLSARIAAQRARAIESVMLSDVRRGAATEAPFLNGRIVETASLHGLDAPAHRRTLALMQELAAGRLAPSPANAALFLDDAAGALFFTTADTGVKLSTNTPFSE